MTKLVQILSLSLLCSGLSAQEISAVEVDSFANLKSELTTLSAQVAEEKKARRNLNYRLGQTKEALVTLQEKTDSQQLRITALMEELREQAKSHEILSQRLAGEMETVAETTGNKVAEVDDKLGLSNLWSLLGGFALLLLGGGIFMFFRSQLSGTSASMEQKLRTTREELMAEGVRLDEKLLGVLDTQLKLQEADRERAKDVAPTVAVPITEESEPDHSLALKVATEITRIRQNVSKMDAKTKGLKQLTAAVNRIENNFAGNGYEIVAMLGKPYVEGMKAITTLVPSEDLPEGEQRITRVIKPQVNYEGVMIQPAQIEVSIGE